MSQRILLHTLLLKAQLLQGNFLNPDDLDKARLLYEQYVSLSIESGTPFAPLVWNNVAVLRRLRSDLRDAQLAMNEVLRHSLAEAQLGDDPRGLITADAATLRQYLEDPLHVTLLFNYAVILDEEGECKAARSLWEKILAEVPQYFDCVLRIAKQEIRTQRLQEAEERLRQLNTELDRQLRAGVAIGSGFDVVFERVVDPSGVRSEHLRGHAVSPRARPGSAIAREGSGQPHREFVRVHIETPRLVPQSRPHFALSPPGSRRSRLLLRLSRLQNAQQGHSAQPFQRLPRQRRRRAAPAGRQAASRAARLQKSPRKRAVAPTHLSQHCRAFSSREPVQRRRLALRIRSLAALRLRARRPALPGPRAHAQREFPGRFRPAGARRAARPLGSPFGSPFHR